jgi:hypothetical protein
MAKSFKKNSFNSNYKQVYITITPNQFLKSYEKYGNDMTCFNIKDFISKDGKTFRNNHLNIKLVDSDEYVPFKITFYETLCKRSIKEPADRIYSSDINVQFRLYKDGIDSMDANNPDFNSPNEIVAVLKIWAEVYMIHMEELISEGYIWKTKDKKIKKQDNGITVMETELKTYMQLDDPDGNELVNPIAYISFENKNKLNKIAQPFLYDDEGNVVRYQCTGEPEVEIFEPNVSFVKVSKNKSDIKQISKLRNPITKKLEPITNINIQHLITYNSLLSGTLKFQIVGSMRGFKMTVFFNNLLYVMTNTKKYNGTSSIDLSIVQNMQNSKEATNIAGSDDSNESDNDIEYDDKDEEIDENFEE